MPVHDWSNVDPNVFHDFHQTWSINIRNALNGGILPKGYSALVEQHAAGLIPDVLALQRRADGKRWSEPSGGLLMATPPNTRHIFQTNEQSLTARANRIAIRHRLGEVVCIMEITSPGNKSSRAAVQAFVEKTVEFLARASTFSSSTCFRRPREIRRDSTRRFGTVLRRINRSSSLPIDR